MPQVDGPALTERMFANRKNWLNGAGPALSGHYKYAFAGGLLIKDPIGVLGLRQLPAVTEQMVDRNFPVGDETCTVRLSDL